MPEITLFGWFHTLVAIVALLAGFYTLARFKVISSEQLSGKIYLICTIIAAASALGIYKHGGFGVAHFLAVLTLFAVLVGGVAEKTDFFGGLSRYMQAASYSATLLFHMIPAITDGLMRLPVGAPFVTELEDPLLRGFYLAFLVTYVVGLGLQFLWLRGKK
ncbi:MAG: hypothetical protein GWP67_13785 [Gammaproteobacteria bacterium]|jgi:uncharacterized membrane protein|nr:hypothetical protein [Gammaproteobacteria bacterium]